MACCTNKAASNLQTQCQSPSLQHKFASSSQSWLELQSLSLIICAFVLGILTDAVLIAVWAA